MANDLTTLAEVKAYCGVNSPNADAVLQSLLDAASPAFAAYCNLGSFFSHTYNATRDGSGSDRLILVNTPVTDVVSVNIDGMNVPKSVGMGAGYDFVIGGRIVFLRGYRFTSGTRNVKITYTAGFNDPQGLYPMPDDLAVAAKMWVSARYRERDKLGIGSKSLAGESVSYTDSKLGATGSPSGGMPAAAANILESYMNYVPEYST